MNFHVQKRAQRNTRKFVLQKININFVIPNRGNTWIFEKEIFPCISMLILPLNFFREFKILKLNLESFILAH